MKRLTTILAALMLAVTGHVAWAVGDQAQIMQDATAVINDFVEIPENAIPETLLQQAYGIAIVPSVIKAGFVVGGQYGKGVLSVRTASGQWSHPVFIKLAGASLGWQIGASSTDIILVFKSQRSVDRIVDGQITLGADASIAAGPVGRSASAATNLRLNAEVYSYSRSRGLFAGVALEGGVISIDEDADQRYYGGRSETAAILHQGDLNTLPPTGRRLVYTLNQYMPAANSSRGVVPYGEVGSGQAPLFEHDPAEPYYSGNQGQRDKRSQAQPYNGAQSRASSGQAQADAGGQPQQRYGSGQAQADAGGQQAQQYGGNQTQAQGSGQVQPYSGGQVQPYDGGQVQTYGNGQAQSHNRGQARPSAAGQSGGGYQSSGANADAGNYGPVYEQSSN